MRRIIGENHAEVSSLVPSIMVSAYRSVVDQYGDYLSEPRPEAVFMEGDKCQQVSEQIIEVLKREYGIPAEFVYIRDRKVFLEYGGKQHVYVLLDNRYLLDGTWQSFLDKTRKNQPYLFLDTHNLEEDLSKSGVPKELWPIWLNYMNGLKQKKAA